VTADWIYLRLRRQEYTEAGLKTWCSKLNDAGIAEAFVFFKHEDSGTGPRLAQQFIDLGE